MDRIDEMPSLKQMYGVINDMEKCEYNGNTSRGYILKGIITLCQPNLTEPEG